MSRALLRPGTPVLKMIERAETPGVKSYGHTADTLFLVGIGFDIVVVSGGHEGYAPVFEFGQDRLGQGSAFLGVGADPEFIEQSQGSGIGVIENRLDRFEMAGKGA